MKKDRIFRLDFFSIYNKKAITVVALELLSLLFYYIFLCNNAIVSIRHLLLFISFVILPWILVSYILGRYNGTLENNFKNLLNRITKDLGSIFFIYFFNIIFSLEDLFNYSFKSLFLVIIFNCLINSFIKIFSINKSFESYKNWYLLTNNKAIKTYMTGIIRRSKEVYGLKVITLDKLESLKNKNNINGLIIDQEIFRNKLFIKKLDLLKKNGIKIFSLRNWFLNTFDRFPLELIDDWEVINKSLEQVNNNVSIRIKRVSEIIFSILMLIIISPFLIIFSLLIYLEDRGPIIYSQERTGFMGRKFNIYKLRTMRLNAEESGVQWWKKGDTRVTKIGKYLRRLRIDEIPQIFNVLKGEMSLIGPRPERPQIDFNLKEEIINYSSRYLVKPGITGWAQVNYPYGASINDAKEKLSYDLYYIYYHSIFIDILIVIKTLKVIFIGTDYESKK